jgi:inosine-uridine nucleoside N-ribohydrolase
MTVALAGGCTALDVSNAVPFMAHPTTVQAMPVSDAPDIAYRRSLATIMAMGGIVQQLQPETHRISAQLYGAVAFNVVVTPHATGSVLTASQRVSDGHIAYGPVRACEQFFAAYGKGGRS